MLRFESDTQPRPDHMAPQAGDSPERDVSASDLSGTRRRVTARPLTPVDSQTVERATWMVKALTVLDDPLDAFVKAESDRELAPVDEPIESVMIVGGDATREVISLPPVAPRRKRRHWLAGLVILTLVSALVGSALMVVTPLASGQTEALAVNASGPLGLPIAFDQANQSPTGQWVAVVGAQPQQEEIGGGAAPGVNAPGSAGLPVSSVKVTVNKAPAVAQVPPGGISPAPLSPWPPANQFTPVPGYHSFTVYGSGGYYWWTFGQCTWWAQNMRRDENLKYMGNAQFWAASARARGYTVGGTPRAGATAVFQPGVQGAGGAGHVAHVEKVYPSGWFLISEMNFYWNGGGWGRVDYRFAHTGWGVQFIY